MTDETSSFCFNFERSWFSVPFYRVILVSGLPRLLDGLNALDCYHLLLIANLFPSYFFYAESWLYDVDWGLNVLIGSSG